MSIKTFIQKTMLASLVLFISLISANITKANATEEQKKIFGVWQLKPTATAKNYQQIKPEFFVLPIESAPESLILAADENVSEVTINEGFKTFVHTQTLPTNGSTVIKNVALTGKILSKAYWVNNKLVIEISTAKGDQMTETFELSANKKQLIVTVQTNGKMSAKSRRVYNRVAEQTEDKTVQIGLAAYPF